MVLFKYIYFTFQLGNLERKWQHHEQNNFVMKECILFCVISDSLSRDADAIRSLRHIIGRSK